MSQRKNQKSKAPYKYNLNSLLDPECQDTTSPSMLVVLSREFSDIIMHIEDGWYDGEEIGGHDELKSTIHLVDGSRIFVYELFFPTTRKKRKHQYDWEYKREHFYKFHSEWHAEKLTKTDPYHIHHQGITQKSRTEWVGDHTLYGVLQHIRLAMQYAGKI
jgi:hypothetical protein